MSGSQRPSPPKAELPRPQCNLVPPPIRRDGLPLSVMTDPHVSEYSTCQYYRLVAFEMRKSGGKVEFMAVGNAPPCPRCLSPSQLIAASETEEFQSGEEKQFLLASPLFPWTMSELRPKGVF
ncbi:hypothetical protein E2C01_029009 [Portunus trituberculatus]|uniref:Uncharacterized protein n=1 Tax=Portunus trituberculatus TaxID=210409 RepID=A0A5B7ETH8_PORTR|nr:hypothetical protein [Portunus trituberculatus]